MFCLFAVLQAKCRLQHYVEEYLGLKMYLFEYVDISNLFWSHLRKVKAMYPLAAGNTFAQTICLEKETNL
jgi:hypothetical protein